MDYSCRDIPMRLDINHQPLSFDIYFSQIIDIPRTSIEERPYDFKLELEALTKVDQILERTQQDNEKLARQQQQQQQSVSKTISELEDSNQTQPKSANLSAGHIPLAPLPPPLSSSPPPPSCPTETLLTPIKSTLDLTIATTNQQQQQPPQQQTSSASNSMLNQINLGDFEDIHYNPFDHLELQTIDERKELDLVFQASYASKK